MDIASDVELTRLNLIQPRQRYNPDAIKAMAILYIEIAQKCADRNCIYASVVAGVFLDCSKTITHPTIASANIQPARRQVLPTGKIGKAAVHKVEFQNAIQQVTANPLSIKGVCSNAERTILL